MIDGHPARIDVLNVYVNNNRRFIALVADSYDERHLHYEEAMALKHVIEHYSNPLFYMDWNCYVATAYGVKNVRLPIKRMEIVEVK